MKSLKYFLIIAFACTLFYVIHYSVSQRIFTDEWFPYMDNITDTNLRNYSNNMSARITSTPHMDNDHDRSTNNQTKKNLMFVKTHKCGTSTLVNVFYLNGVRKKLNFVLNPYAHKINLKRLVYCVKTNWH